MKIRRLRTEKVLTGLNRLRSTSAVKKEKEARQAVRKSASSSGILLNGVTVEEEGRTKVEVKGGRNALDAKVLQFGSMEHKGLTSRRREKDATTINRKIREASRKID